MILLPPSDRSLQRIPVVGNAKKTTGNPHVSSMATTGYHAHLFHPDAVTTTHQSQSHGNCSATARGKLQTSWGDGWYSMSKAGQGVGHGFEHGSCLSFCHNFHGVSLRSEYDDVYVILTSL